jgi:glycolate oxidase FAD binding subunit
MEGGRVFAGPRSTEEVAAVLGSATALGVSVEPCGSASKLAWRNAANSPLVIETTSLNRVLEHTWQDMTCTVEAGCTWSALQASLAQHHQFVALDPLWPQRATIGGIIATNDSGALRLKYGSLRDLIIGMTIVLSDGTIARSGGKVVKNVAGYDLHKLMTGAFGTLGLITEVTFRLHAVPQHALNLSIPHTSPEAVGALLLRLLDTHLSLQAMQLRGIGDNFTLDVQLASLPAALDTQRASVMAMAAELGLTPQPAQPDIWQARQNLFSDETAILCKATMLPSNIAAAAAAIHAMGGDSVTQATGIMTAAIQIASAEKLIALRRDLERSGGSLVILQQPPSGSLDRWGTPPDSLPLMRNLKQQFDPARTLNPGSFLGGI